MGHEQSASLLSQWPGFTAHLHVLKLHAGNALPPHFEECIRHRERAKGLHDAHLSLSLPLEVSYFA